MNSAFDALKQYPQWIGWVTRVRKGKVTKVPVDPFTGIDIDPATKAFTYEQAASNPNVNLGFYFTESDPFFFLDLDGCIQEGGYSASARAYMADFDQCAVEISHSGRGLHIIGIGSPTVPNAERKKRVQSLEFYTQERFVALTGNVISGSAAGVAPQDKLDALVEQHLIRRGPGGRTDAQWTTECLPGYTAVPDDDELIRRARKAASGRVMFSGEASFDDLWTRNITPLSKSYPPDASSSDPFNFSSADAALAQHLLFWTGGNCERTQSLMLKSGLVREKWYSHASYLRLTITEMLKLLPERSIAAEIVGGSDAQKQYAETVRAQKIAEVPELASLEAPAAFWCDKADTPAKEILSDAPVRVADGLGIDAPVILTGAQVLGPVACRDYFKGCVYVQDMHRVLDGEGVLMKPDQFKAAYGGYEFTVGSDGQRTTRNAFEAVTESQAVRFPKVHSTCFRPELAEGEIITEEGKRRVNVWRDLKIRRVSGDASPFINHLKKLLPDEQDANKLLAYLAAVVQHQGVKFKWCPLIQGAQGNGKTLFTRVVRYAVGGRYTHMPRAKELDGQFNDWLLHKVLIGVEDVYTQDSMGRRSDLMETLKPMITGGDGYEIEGKGEKSITTDLCANFILNSNHKDALRITRDDRRFAVFFTAQQSSADLRAAGLTAEYFIKLHHWLEAQDGYAITAEFLSTYPIPPSLNPATGAVVAPLTSTSEEVFTASLGSIEQEIMEQEALGTHGFCGGWISSVALSHMLERKRKGSLSHSRRGEILKDLGYVPHPSLPGGRIGSPMAEEGGSRPRLYVRLGSDAAAITDQKTIKKAYLSAQKP